MSKRRGSKQMIEEGEPVDLNPLIDVITMLIVFFLIAGKLSNDQRGQQITVPPTLTAEKMETPVGWTQLLVNVRGYTQAVVEEPTLEIQVGTDIWRTTGEDDYSAYASLREMLDAVYISAQKFPDPKGTGMQLPKVILEIRADANTQYRVVQEIMQIATDSIDPNNKMLPKVHRAPTDGKPFINVNYTTRGADDK